MSKNENEMLSYQIEKPEPERTFKRYKGYTMGILKLKGKKDAAKGDEK